TEQAAGYVKTANEVIKTNAKLKKQFEIVGMTEAEAQTYKYQQIQADIPVQYHEHLNELMKERAALLDKIAEKEAKHQRLQDLMAEGKTIYEETRKPLEIYEAQLTKLSDMLKAGAIDWETYGRAVRMARETLQASMEQPGRVETGSFQTIRASLVDVAGLSIGGAQDPVVNKLETTNSVLIQIRDVTQRVLDKEGII
ncbi:unnamed protein product, partial [marine sediment metagenome]